jgi:hypothetical protein
MKPDLSDDPREADDRKAITDSLAAVFGWFEAAPVPEHLASLIEQLDSAPEPRPAEIRVYSGA